jgi:PAS domain S-box-containing protein
VNGEVASDLHKPAHEMLPESTLKLLFERSADAILLIDGDVFVDCNQAAVQMLQYSSKEELLSTHPSVFSPPFQPDGRSSFEKANEMIATALGRGNHRFEWMLKLADGSVLPVEVLLTAIPLDGRQILYTVWRNITKRKRAEERLSLLQSISMEVAAAIDLTNALEVVLQRVCEKTGWAIGQAWVPRQDGVVLDCSPAWFPGVGGLAKFRATSEEVSFPPGIGLPGRVWASKQPAWIVDVTLDANFPRAEVASEVGLKAALGIPILSGDDVLAVIEFFLREPQREDERLVGVIVTVAAELGRVIERKRAEESLMWEKSFSDSTIDSLPGVFYHYDHEGRFLRWNKNFERVTGYSHQEIVGMHPLEFFSGDDKHLIAERIGEVFTTGEATAEARLVCKDGRAIPYFFTGRRVLFDGKPYLVGMGIDITERMKAEEELRRTQADLAHVTRVTTMSELAASIAHEVNQPLGAIVGNAEICLQKLSDRQPDIELVREALADIASDGLRASEVIARIRDLVKKRIPQKTQFDLNVVIREVLVLVGHEARRKLITLRGELGVDLPCVLGDRVQLQQVLLNLVINGIEAMAGVEGRTRELRVMTEKGEGNWVLASVRDCGIGIDPKNPEQMFKTFHTTKPGGMGMGLAISRSIIEAHGGRLWAEAHDGPGATFMFKLPAGKEGGS